MRRRKAIGFSVSTFFSSITISPDVGSIRRFTMRNSVVLPEPEVPTSIHVLPSGTSKVTASTAGLPAPGYCLVISWNAIFAILSAPLLDASSISYQLYATILTIAKLLHVAMLGYCCLKQQYPNIANTLPYFPKALLHLRLSLYVNVFIVLRYLMWRATCSVNLYRSL